MAEETKSERLDRELIEMLNELRVVLPHGREGASWRVSMDEAVERRRVADTP